MLPISYKAKKRIYFVFLIFLALFLAFFAGYHMFHWQIAYHLLPGCLFHEFFHLYCPGCGGTRAVDALLQGKFLHSLLYNPFILYTALVFVYYYIAAGYTFLVKRDGKIYYKISNWILFFAPVLIIGYFVLRNLLLVYFHIDFLQDLIVYW